MGDRLSPREREILTLIAEGNTSKDVAAALGISSQTVKNYVTSILLKLQARNRAHAVAVAKNRGILP